MHKKEKKDFILNMQKKNMNVFSLANPVSWADTRIRQSLNKDGTPLPVPLYFSFLYRQQQLR